MRAIARSAATICQPQHDFPADSITIENLEFMPRRRFYKYFDEKKWAEAFLDGNLLFRSLGYFRDYEDAEIRGDYHEGTMLYRPTEGLVINNKTQGKTFTLPGWTLESEVKGGEIFVYCLSRSLNDVMREKFRAAACVEIRDINTFCARIAKALPSHATFDGPPNRTRIGWRVKYFHETEGVNPRWALPGQIAASKSYMYAWQDEFRLLFSITDALAFEQVKLQLVQKSMRRPQDPTLHHGYHVHAESMRDICLLHEF
jgi:hypothetical protein